jgi:murein L,D-transpeptidase YcbB/YkuD
MFYAIINKWIALNKGLLTLFIVSCFVASSFAQQPAAKEASTKEDSIMVQKFYATWHEPLFWLSSGKNTKRATEWLKVIESTDNSGFVANKTETNQIRMVLSSKKLNDNILKEKTDKQITGLVLNFIKYLQQGNINFEYDEVNVPLDSVYIFQLIFSSHKGSVSKIVSKLDCKDPDYLVLKKFLHDSITDKNSVKYKTVVLAMNYRKYLTTNHHSEYILVNIPEAEATYFKNDLPALKMRTVPGKKTNPTPTIAYFSPLECSL